MSRKGTIVRHIHKEVNLNRKESSDVGTEQTNR